MEKSVAGLRPPAVVLAADHRARGVLTVERYADYLSALAAAVVHCDGVLASAQPLADLGETLRPDQRRYLSLNRTGLAGSAFELDDRLVASVWRAAEDGCDGVKTMTRIAMGDPVTAGALELLGQVLEEARAAGLEALVESVVWADGAMDRRTEAVVFAAVVAHDMGAPVLKVPVPDEPPGAARADAVGRVVQSVGVPVLFLGGPRSTGPDEEVRARVLAEVADVMAGGGAGMALGRAVYLDPDPAAMARRVAEVVRGAETAR